MRENHIKRIGMLEEAKALIKRPGNISKQDREKVFSTLEESILYENDLHTQIAYDYKTQLFSGKMFEHDLVAGIDRAKNVKKPLALVLMDLDGFKQINFDKGYKRADKILIKFAKTLKRNLHSYDNLYRVNGEAGDEFALILPNENSKEAYKVMSRVRPVLLKEAKLSISVGIATYKEHALKSHTLFDRAEEALVYSKNYGKQEEIDKINIYNKEMKKKK